MSEGEGAAVSDGDGGAVERPLLSPAILLGIGLGGLLDGIVLHQILQWHHVLSADGCCPTSTLAGLEDNTLADGVFHLAVLIVTFAGAVAALTRLARRPARAAMAGPDRSAAGRLGDLQPDRRRQPLPPRAASRPRRPRRARRLGHGLPLLRARPDLHRRGADHIHSRGYGAAVNLRLRLSALIFTAACLATAGGCGDDDQASVEATGAASYCELAATADRAGDEAFAALEANPDATDRQYAQAERKFIRENRDLFHSLIAAAPSELQSDLRTLVAAQRALAGFGEGPDRSAIQAAERRVKAFERSEC